MSEIEILPIPCLRDNYAYLVHRRSDSRCFVVDPSEAEPVRNAVDDRGLRLEAVLNTHHHWDHVGGNVELGAPVVVAHESDAHRIPGFGRGVRHDERFTVAGIDLSVLHVPGHTSGAVAYVGDGFAFTGDTLFCCGCGRLFEGTAEQLNRSLNETLATIPDGFVIHSGHEYTENNLRFALGLEPENPALKSRLEEVSAARSRGRPCASAPMGRERSTNPFLRCADPNLRRAVGCALDESDEAVFARLRRLKDAA